MIIFSNSFGLVPDEGDAGGSRQTMSQLNSALGVNSASYGWYAQAKSGTTFDGSQLLSVIDDVKACDCVFQPAVMPTGGWKGLTNSDNSQAIAIANVMKKFTDRGIPVWLRFAHEANYYQTDGTYSGNVSDFQAGWSAVAAACNKIAPEVKMWWTPNVADSSSYSTYAPTDMSTVHLVGVDYYPKALSTGSEFIDTMKKFHDTYAVQGRMFAIGETGLGYAGSDSDKMSWLKQLTSAKVSLPKMIAFSWFNYQKTYDYRIIGEKQSTITNFTREEFKI
ncbi:glycoside hydrolase superfamily [Phakopsora pachyrhizi]|uniref:Glycoside hydrolase superfamily n=1 Tax=Phakopsora pachyrhizi TaxID=170000 RepID=A0AAV0BKQ9_PHAPC|nr:glycoside hydrolase superfamily [Phakopsora pachyrhizi]CAH7687267.1 glycoside hydrolase superfamily [Phakopsora pachyrhizi]